MPSSNSIISLIWLVDNPVHDTILGDGTEEAEELLCVHVEVTMLFVV